MANLQKERYTRPIFKEMVASNGYIAKGGTDSLYLKSSMTNQKR